VLEDGVRRVELDERHLTDRELRLLVPVVDVSDDLPLQAVLLVVVQVVAFPGLSLQELDLREELGGGWGRAKQHASEASTKE
jgi:hypothetical protein